MDVRTDQLAKTSRLKLLGVQGADEFHVAPMSAPSNLALPSLLDRLVGELSTLSVDHVQVRDFLHGLVVDAITRREVPQEKLRAPRADIFLPAVEALRYSNSRQEIANLVATNMDGRVAHTVLPSYIEVLKQISNDEIELLKLAPILGRFAPAADLLYVYSRGQTAVGYKHILPEFLAKACSVRSNIPQYVDNMMRLSLLERPVGEEADDEHYRTLGKFEFVQELKRTAPPRSRVAVGKGVIGVTDFGDQFRRACLE